ncbi:MAG TPA: MaoC family dehydratase N-terminal domain-containing protein, partial [Burkholderiales bacterium]|nr:MaoC family dehydratase N-terminal domain-containing protein [Burkholderiales bacterium]
ARTRRPQPSKGTAVKAGDEYEFRAPVRVGDTITVTQRLADIEVKEGKSGPMYLVIAEGEFKNQRGETVCMQRLKTFRWGM